MTAAAGAKLPAAVEGGAVLPSGTMTFLVADAERSVTGRDGARHAPAAAAEPEVVVERAAASHSGMLLAEAGATTVAVFADPADAVVAAWEAQCCLNAASAAPTSEVRMAVHTGPVVLRGEGDYAGTTLDHARRLLTIGHGGQVLVSAATVDGMTGRLPAGASLMDLGNQQLADLTRSERCGNWPIPTCRPSSRPCGRWTASATTCHLSPRP